MFHLPSTTEIIPPGGGSGKGIVKHCPPPQRRALKGGERMQTEKNAVRPRGTDSAKVIEVIVTEALEGRGTMDDPCYIKTQYWSLDGKLLAVGTGRPTVGLSMMCYRLGKARRTCFGERQLRGRIGKLLY